MQLCLNHYEQTLKYGGRKNTPSKAEIDLLTAVKRFDFNIKIEINILEWSKWWKTSNIFITRWKSINAIDNTIDGIWIF